MTVARMIQGKPDFPVCLPGLTYGRDSSKLDKFTGGPREIGPRLGENAAIERRDRFQRRKRVVREFPQKAKDGTYGCELRFLL
jgi:hypothetical protein